jgi:hypothetical protein
MKKPPQGVVFSWACPGMGAGVRPAMNHGIPVKVLSKINIKDHFI